MSVEWQIVLLCSRVSLSSTEQVKFHDLSSPQVNWSKVFQIAKYHRTHPLVYRNVLQYVKDFIPEEILTSAKSCLKRQVTVGLRICAELIRVLSLLEEQGVKAVPFKGPAFTDCYYGDCCLRCYCDLDILVHAADLPEAARILLEKSFKPLFPLSSSQLQALARTDNEYPFSHSSTGLAVDLQWELTGGYSSCLLGLKELAPHLQPYNFFGKSIELFGLEDHIVYLCVHGNQHVWEQLDQVCCVAETLRHGEKADWDLVWKRAEELRVTRIVRIGLVLAMRLLDAPVPQPVVQCIMADQKAVHLAEERADRLMKSSCETTTRELSRRFVVYHWQSLDSLWLVIRYGLKILFVPTRYDWQQLPLPAWLSPLHFITRPMRLLWAGVRVVMKQRGLRS